MYGNFFRGLIGLFVLLSLWGGMAARGDGCYMPERAYAALPTIPQQQAVIVYRNGVETLIVESAFQTESPEVGWILPLPAVPTKLELAEPGVVTSTAYGLAPQITHDLHDLIRWAVVICLAVVPFAMVAIFIRDWLPRREMLRYVLYAELILFVCSGVLLPSLGSAGTPVVTTAGVSVLSTQRLGDAEFTVLRATNPDDLDQWLSGQSLRGLDAAAKTVVGEYIKEHWCFVVGHLHKASGELAVPRPLMVTFPVAQAIFPMRITALAKTTTHVELCVIADQEATASGFHCAVADQFTHQPAESHTYSPSKADYYAGIDSKVAVGHPDVVELMWPNCVATKLTADLAPGAMDQDVALSLVPLTAHRDTVYTDLARREIALSVLAVGGGVFLVMAAIFLRGRRKPSRLEGRMLLGDLVVTFGVALCLYLILPTIAVHVQDRAGRYMDMRQRRDLPVAASVLANEGLIRQDMTAVELAGLPRLMVDRGLMTEPFLDNPYTGQPIRAESSPGNFAVRVIDGNVYFCTYDQYGIESRTQILPRPAQGE